MSIEQLTRTLSQLGRELGELEKKLTGEMQKEVTINKKVCDIRRNMARNSSLSTCRSNSMQLQRYEGDKMKIEVSKASLRKKITEKEKKRNDLLAKLEKEKMAENKRILEIQKKACSNNKKYILDRLVQIPNSSIKPGRSNIRLSEVDGEEYDVFISHATEDKESFVDELCKELQNRGIKVWYDTINIAWGDSLRSQIDKGLKKSKYGIVVISKDYIEKGWTQYELDGLFQREMTGGKTILPIWHNISQKEVQDFSPGLAGRLAMDTAKMTPTEIAEKLGKMLFETDGFGSRNNE